MSKIYGDENTIKKARDAKPGDTISYVNWEAIDELPDEFESRIEKVKFDINKDFDLTGDDMYYPHADLMNRIAEKRGISGTLNSKIETITENININPLLCKQLEDPPTIQKKIVGMRVTKVGYTLEIDGTLKPSLPCTVDFNVWNRCCNEWSKEEEKTNGYDKSIQKAMPNGNIYYELEYYDKKTKKKIPYKFFPKYNTKYKRNAHFEKLKLFDQRNADTKSKNVVVRTIMGMPTGFLAEELKEGYFIVYRICRSRNILKLETAANLNRISKGDTPSSAAAILFTPDEEEMEEVAEEMIHEEDAFETEDIIPTKEEKLLGIFQTYEKLEELSTDDKAVIGKCIKWLKSKPDQKKDNYNTLWDTIIVRLKSIEPHVDIEHYVDRDFE